MSKLLEAKHKIIFNSGAMVLTPQYYHAQKLNEGYIGEQFPRAHKAPITAHFGAPT
jgi:hypothetical protein